MLSNDMKKELPEYFGIKNISVSKAKEGYWDVNTYYKIFLSRKNKIEDDKKKLEEEKQAEEKRKLKNKLKKLRKKINRQAKQVSSESEDETDDDEEEQQVKPYIFFIPQLQPLFDENLFIIKILNNY